MGDATHRSPQRGGEGMADSVGHPLLRLSSVTKRYGNTKALAGVDLAIGRGEIVGIVGHNGAGKSTLMRVILGITSPDAGAVEFGTELLGGAYSLPRAHSLGIRIVFQELALCPSLRVFENASLSRSDLRGRRWRRRSREVIAESLEDVFPGNRVSPRAAIGQLPLAQRQMVEIAQAVIGEVGEVSLLVLDEPTSALSKESAEQLFNFLRRLRSKGVSTILISHRMQEVLNNTDRTIVMRDGQVVGERRSNETSNDELLALMGGTSAGTAGPSTRRQRSEGQPLLDVRDLSTRRLHGITLEVRRGEVVGLAGLDGQGQHELLLELWRARHRWRTRAVRCWGQMAFVTGDRQSAGIFPLWDLARNASASAMGDISSFGLLKPAREVALAERWIERLAIRGRGLSGILELSGGTQQKVLVARALATRADIVLLDDPFRGVDVATKRETYQLIDEETAKGRAFIWFSTENAELEECDRVYVLRGGRMVTELSGDEAREDRVIAASFASEASANRDDVAALGASSGKRIAAQGGRS